MPAQILAYPPPLNPGLSPFVIARIKGPKSFKCNHKLHDQPVISFQGYEFHVNRPSRSTQLYSGRLLITKDTKPKTISLVNQPHSAPSNHSSDRDLDW